MQIKRRRHHRANAVLVWANAQDDTEVNERCAGGQEIGMCEVDRDNG